MLEDIIILFLAPEIGGRERSVRTLVDVKQPGGAYTVVWDGRDEQGAASATGVYFAQLRWNERSETRKIVLVK